MKKIRLFDNLFAHGKSASLGGDNADEAPKHVEWVREGATQPISWFTDGHIKDVAKYSPKKAVAWLLEPRCLHPEDYEAAIENAEHFEAILSYDLEFLQEVSNGLYYPYGGSWIHPDKWGMHPKTKKMSMIINMDKQDLPGHKFRHELLEKYGDQIDVFGYGINEVDSKFDALAPYEMSIVVESCQIKGYFTEKLIDCFSVGTIPLYWGWNDCWDYFNVFGINDYYNIDRVMTGKAKKVYGSYRSAVEQNIELARQFRCVEDWLFLNYPHLFGV
jgi:hypothetical protein